MLPETDRKQVITQISLQLSFWSLLITPKNSLGEKSALMKYFVQEIFHNLAFAVVMRYVDVVADVVQFVIGL